MQLHGSGTSLVILPLWRCFALDDAHPRRENGCRCGCGGAKSGHTGGQGAGVTTDSAASGSGQRPEVWQMRRIE